MRKTILALATAGALAGTALPASAQWYRDHDDRDNRPYRYHSYEHYRSDYPRRYDYDDYRYRYRHWWWWRHHDNHHHHHDYYDRP